jgi:TupA-like ATPgrasp
MRDCNKKTNWLMKSVELKFKIFRCFFSNDIKYKSRKHTKDFGHAPNLVNPKTFNEKIIFRMLYEDNASYTLLADKVNAKFYVSSIIGSQYVVPVIGVYENFDDIDFEKLPVSFVLKCSHDSESCIICHDKRFFDKEDARKKMHFCLSRNMYHTTREKHYRYIEPVIVCEEYLDVYKHKKRDLTPELYRVHCFDSIPKFIEADFTDSSGKEFVNVYNDNWELQDVTVGFPNKTENIACPQELKELLRLSTILAGKFDYVRLDWFVVDGSLFFSEFTFTPCSGRMKFHPVDFDAVFGSYWNQGVYARNNIRFASNEMAGRDSWLDNHQSEK